MRNTSRGKIEDLLFGMMRENLRAFCLERWQSLHENFARTNMSESGVFPLRLNELESFGLNLEELMNMEIGYGWTGGSPELRERIAELYKGEVSREEVLVTAGSAEANLVAAMSTVKLGETAVVDLPNYMQIPGLIEFLGGKKLELRRSPPSWAFPIERAINIIEERRPKAAFICNPNNPTATVIPEKDIAELGDAARRAGTILIFDEVYWGSELSGERPSALEILGKDSAVSVSGLSKVYGLPGLRIGWLSGKKEIVERAWSAKDYVSIAPSILSDKIASHILGGESIERLRSRAKEIVRKNLREFLSRASGDLLSPLQPQAGAFIWASVPWEENTLSLALDLFENWKILVNPGECFESPGYLRIGLGQEPKSFSGAMDELVGALSKEREKRVNIEKMNR
ncbi:MAG: pyridoxal phosphate-dependent aminotransferase [Fervidicoccaceae archaeon]